MSLHVKELNGVERQSFNTSQVRVEGYPIAGSHGC